MIPLMKRTPSTHTRAHAHTQDVHAQQKHWKEVVHLGHSEYPLREEEKR